FVGAIVRSSGAGLGCPDWPKCWGLLIPPTSADQIDVDKLDIPRYKRYAERHGIDPDTVTRETVLAGFNPVHTWTEFVNRLTSLPLGLSTLLLALFSFRASRNRGWIIALAWFAFLDVLFNAWMGAVVVRSGLKPGIITLHMALALLLICVLVTLIWLARPPKDKGVGGIRYLRWVTLLFFACLFAEGIFGSQVREMTDQLAKAAGDIPRSEWIGALDSTTIYQIHRSFSWSLLVTAGAMFWLARRSLGGAAAWEPKVILGIVIAMMVMGIVLAHVAILPVVQVLHVGFTAILLAVTWKWVLEVLFNSRREHSV
ncbi:MAG: COX15/CtaA family protein, partial [Verrucomicrobiota bacterium]